MTPDPELAKEISREGDLFNVSWVPDLVQNGISEPDNHDWVSRLVVLASTRISRLTQHDTSKSMILITRFVELVEQLIRTDGVVGEEWFVKVLRELTCGYGELPLPFLHLFLDPVQGDSGWQAMVRNPWSHNAIIATLSFARYLRSKSPQDLEKVERLLLQSISAPSSDSSSPTSSQQADIQNSIATTFEAQGTIVALQRATEIRIKLVDQHPDKYRLDLAYTLLHYTALTLNNQYLDQIEVPPIMSTRSKATLVVDKTLELANCLTNLTNRLCDVDLDGDAFMSASELVTLLRQLIGNTTDPNIAASLYSFSSGLSSKGRHEEALRLTEEVVRMRRTLAARDPGTYQSALATSLTRLCNCHRSLGNREGSLEASEEAVKICRGLFTGDPVEEGDLLALSLVELSTAQSELGQLEDALNNIQEAVRLYEILAKDHPTAFNPALASSLNNLSLRLSDLGQYEDALTAIKRAVKIREVLAEDCPAASNPRLASSLNNLSLCLSDLGQHEEALVAIKRAIELYEILAKDHPAVFIPRLANSLDTLSKSLSTLGQHKDAFAAVSRSLDMRETLAKARPSVFNEDLAESLNTISGCHSALGQHNEALVAIKRAISLRETLAKSWPAKFNPDLAGSLFNLSRCCSNLDLHDDALKPAQDSLVLYRGLARQYPAVFNRKAIKALARVSECLFVLGREDEAQGVVEEQDTFRV